MPEWPVQSSYFSCLLELNDIGSEAVDSFNESRERGGKTENERRKSSQAKEKGLRT